MSGWIIDEDARLAALRATGLLDSGGDPALDALVAEAAALCGTPVALVTLLDADLQVFKARVGTDVEQTPIELAICTHTLAAGAPIEIADLSRDPRTAANALVTGEPFVRFYAGAPIRTRSGHMLGTLCVLDVAPRPEGLGEARAAGLAALAARAATLVDGG